MKTTALIVGPFRPDLPPPDGTKVHRIGSHHVIPTNLVGDNREELVVWDPTDQFIFVYTQRPFTDIGQLKIPISSASLQSQADGLIHAPSSV
ncbi:hypothetical protein CA13_60640 [Planctomycetes bacterium CA13]|uniref:Uncharacterized protein n=1 Tax=Novipirellula herctigrandis TaxID=2527986 RepID=A0A5C5ZBA4_9BACT|nr:hypothetical protein CA13_60640 [Planctomycetes bacterium CA13]